LVGGGDGNIAAAVCGDGKALVGAGSSSQPENDEQPQTFIAVAANAGT
jgi:hypothetical protein